MRVATQVAQNVIGAAEGLLCVHDPADPSKLREQALERLSYRSGNCDPQR
jgi:hypothetical protein